MKVRELTDKDCFAIAYLEEQLFAGRFDIKALKSMIRKPAFYGAVVASDNDTKEIFSYCLAFVVDQDLDIVALGTDKKWQRSGFARAILKHLIEISVKSNIRKIFLEVAVNNLPARNLYDSFGFVTLGCRKNYYSYGASQYDALTMVCSIESAFS